MRSGRGEGLGNVGEIDERRRETQSALEFSGVEQERSERLTAIGLQIASGAVPSPSSTATTCFSFVLRRFCISLAFN